MWRGPQWRAQPAAALEKKNPAHPLHCTPCRVCAPWRGSRVRGAPDFLFFFWDQKEKKIPKPSLPLFSKKSVQSVQALQYPVYHPLSSASYTPPLPAPLTGGFTLLHRTNLTPPPSTHSSPYPNQKKKKPCARRRLMTRMYHVRSQHGGATKKPPQCHATPVPLFVPSRRSPSRATHEVPSHSPDSLPSTNFCSRLFQPSHHLPLLLRPYRSQLDVAGRRRRAAAAAAARATAGQR